MKLCILTIAAVGILALPLAACGTAGINGQNQFIAAVTEVAKDPRCGHTDRIDIDLSLTGPRGKLFLERNCPLPAPTPLASAVIK